ncbi:hypothetical protein BKA93DRAFT_752711 [Sparassis latifolia]
MDPLFQYCVRVAAEAQRQLSVINADNVHKWELVEAQLIKGAAIEEPEALRQWRTENFRNYKKKQRAERRVGLYAGGQQRLARLPLRFCLPIYGDLWIRRRAGHAAKGTGELGGSEVDELQVYETQLVSELYKRTEFSREHLYCVDASCFRSSTLGILVSGRWEDALDRNFYMVGILAAAALGRHLTQCARTKASQLLETVLRQSNSELQMVAEAGCFDTFWASVYHHEALWQSVEAI